MYESLISASTPYPSAAVVLVAERDLIQPHLERHFIRKLTILVRRRTEAGALDGVAASWRCLESRCRSEFFIREWVMRDGEIRRVTFFLPTCMSSDVRSAVGMTETFRPHCHRMKILS